MRSRVSVVRWAGRGGSSVFAVVLAAAVSMLPLAVLAAPPAQDEALDPAVLAFIQSSAAKVAASVGTGGVVVAAPLTEEPVTEEPVTEEPVTEERVGEVVIEESVEVSNDVGVTLMAPANWVVEAGEGETIFSISDESISLEGEMQDFGTAFPGLVIFPVFEGQADMLVSSLGEGAVNTGVSRVELAQGVPGLRIGFSDVEGDDGNVLDGAIYLFAPGSRAYGLFAGSEQSVWAEVAPAVDAVAQSITFGDDLLTMVTGTSEGLALEDPQGHYSLTLPDGWLGSTTEDEDLRVVIADPEVSIVGAVMAETDIGDNSESLRVLTEAIAGSLSDEEAASLLEGIISTLDMGSSEVQIDSDLTEILPGSGDSLGTVKLVGSAPIEDGPTFPLVLYLSIYTDKVGGIVFFGEADGVAAQEEAILGVLESITFAE